MNWLNLINASVSILNNAVAAKGQGATKKEVVTQIAISAAPVIAGLSNVELEMPEVAEALSEYIDATAKLKKAVKANTGKDI